MAENSSLFRVPFRLRIISAALAVSVAGLAVPALAGSAVAHAAQAAAKPSLVLTFASSTVTASTQPEVTFVGTGMPSGTVLYLQRGTAQGAGWQNVARSASMSGTAKIPADQPGSYEYKMVAVDGKHVVATSADALLTVTGLPGSCTICKITHGVLPWLKSVASVTAGWLIGKALEWLWNLF
jgi:hypothetical protein